MTKRENLKILWIVLYEIFADLYWTAAWDNWLGLFDDYDRDKSTEIWSKAQIMKTKWCADYVYHGSGWHGLHTSINEKPMVIQVITIQEHQDSWLKEQAKESNGK
jgi:hypothetical protein